MDSHLLGRRLAAIAGLSAIIAMGALTPPAHGKRRHRRRSPSRRRSRRRPPRRPKRASTPRAETCSLHRFRRPRRRMCLPASILASAGFPRSLWSPLRRTVNEADGGALPAAGDPRGRCAPARRGSVKSLSDNRTVIGGPLALLLASSTDLGPSRDDSAQLTVTLPDSARPQTLIEWASTHRIRVRWRPDDAWAVVEGAAQDVATAFDVPVNDYRGRKGQVFYASPQQPSVPEPLRGVVTELGRILGTPRIVRRGPDSFRWTCRTGD